MIIDVCYGPSAGTMRRQPLSSSFVDGHRRYAEEPEPNWYAAQRSPGTTGSHASPAVDPYAPPAPGAWESGVHERPSGAFRLPDQRAAAPDPVTSTGSHALPAADPAAVRVPVRGPEYPAVRPGGGAAPSLAESLEQPTSMVPTTGARPAPVPESVYNSRRPVSAVVCALATVVLLVPALLLLAQVTFAADPVAGGVVPAVLLTLGLPLTGTGLYALASGGRVGGRDAWLRPPLAYLPVGLLVLLAAGLAVG